MRLYISTCLGKTKCLEHNSKGSFSRISWIKLKHIYMQLTYEGTDLKGHRSAYLVRALAGLVLLL